MRATASTSALSRLRNSRPSLNPAERQVVDYILENVEAIPYSTVSAIAAKSGVSEATVIRVSRSTGFTGFHDLKIQLAQSMVEHVKHIQGDLEEEDPPEAILEKVFRANIQALEESLQTIDRSEFARASDAIARARRVLFFGVGTSGTVALDAVQKFLLTGIQVSAYNDIVLQRMSASIVEPTDVIVGLSQSGATEATVSALSLAKKTGATTIAVTSNGNSQITKHADIALIISVLELSFQSASSQLRTAQLSVVDALCFSVAVLKRDIYLRNSARSVTAAKSLHVKD